MPEDIFPRSAAWEAVELAQRTETEEHVAVQRAISAAKTDITAPCFDTSDWNWWPSSSADEAIEGEALVAAGCAGPSPLVVGVLLAWIRLLPKYGYLPANPEEKTADFHWSWVRMVLGGAGHGCWRQLADACISAIPTCPFDPDASPEVWKTDLGNAHIACGWPVGFGWMNPAPIRRALEDAEADEWGQVRWTKHLALLHLLKHTRYDPTSHRVTVHYNGTSHYYTRSARATAMAPDAIELAPLLGFAAGSGKRKSTNPLDMALASVLSRFSPVDLLPARPLSDLPGVVLTGPWAGTTPSHPAPGFARTGRKLTGVYVASRGKVLPYDGDDDDVLGFDWNIGQRSCDPVERTAFEGTLPKTYEANGFPADQLFELFPNIDLSTFEDPTAFKAMLDACFVAAIQRTEAPILQTEFPLILVMPSSPTLAESTNQGKTLCAHAIARAFTPAVPVSSMPNTSSAPDMRSLADGILQHGTLCLDEWFPPAAESHLLSHRNLQSLMTGGVAQFGRVMENTGGVRLRQSLVASAKAVPFPPDMINRTLPLWLLPLSEAQRNDGAAAWRLKSGQASIGIRLSAVDLAQRVGLPDPAQGSIGWRFNGLLSLALRIYCLRTGKTMEQASKAIAETFESASNRLISHEHVAEASGVMLQLREGRCIAMPLEGIMGGIESAQFPGLATAMGQPTRTDKGKGWYPVSAILRARAAIMGMDNRPLASMLPALTGYTMSASDRLVARAFIAELSARIPPGGHIEVANSPVVIHRHPDVGECLFHVECRVQEQPCPTPASGSVSISTAPSPSMTSHMEPRSTPSM